MWKQVEKVDKVWKQVLVETQKLAVANIAISSNLTPGVGTPTNSGAWYNKDED